MKKDRKKAEKIVKDLNKILNDKVHFSIDEKGKLNILVYEEKLKSKAGRPVGHDFDYERVEQLKSDGKTNKEIYTALGISKALYYLRMKEAESMTKKNYITGRLGYNDANGRYGLLVSDLWEKSGFNCGESLEVLVDKKWIKTKMEMSTKQEWYLAGTNLKGEQLEYVKARINR